MLKFAKSQHYQSGSFCQIYRVTDEAVIAETVVWPNFFLMNVFFALKGSKLFYYYYNGENLISTQAPSVLIGLCSFFAGKEDNHKISDEFEFCPDSNADCGVSCPWASEKIT